MATISTKPKKVIKKNILVGEPKQDLECITIDYKTWEAMFEHIIQSSLYKLYEDFEYMKSDKFVIFMLDEEEDDLEREEIVTLATLGDIDIRYVRTLEFEEHNDELCIRLTLSISLTNGKFIRKDIKFYSCFFTLEELRNQREKIKELQSIDDDLILEITDLEHQIYNSIKFIYKFKKCSNVGCFTIIPKTIEKCFHCSSFKKIDECFCMDSELLGTNVKLPCCNKIIHKCCFYELPNKDKSELSSDDKVKLENSKHCTNTGRFKVCPYCREFVNKDIIEQNKYVNFKII